MAGAVGLDEGSVPSGQHPLLLGMIAASLDNLLGTMLVDELLGWSDDMWLEVVRGSPLIHPQTVFSERSKLLYFLEQSDLKPPPGLAKLLRADDPQPPTRSPRQMRIILRALNGMESTFDDELDYYLYEAGGLDWGRLRQELGLAALPEMEQPIFREIERTLVEGMSADGCPVEMIDRARQLWADYILVVQGEVQPLRKPESWAAGLEYLAHRLYFEWLTLAEAGETYGVSASTVSSRYHTLRIQLGLKVYESHFDKAWQATDVLKGWDDVSADEMLRRLVDRFGDSAPTRPAVHEC
jgi:hypothetical protein